MQALIRQSKRLASLIEKAQKTVAVGMEKQEIDKLVLEYQAIFEEQKNVESILLSYKYAEEDCKEAFVSTSLEENKLVLNELYSLPLNRDIVIRQFEIMAEPIVKGMIVYLEGLADKAVINQAVLNPLMVFGKTHKNLYKEGIIDAITTQLVPAANVTTLEFFDKVQASINVGDAVIFLDGVDKAFAVESKGWEHRGISRPFLEPSIKGMQNAFTDVLAVNTAQIRSVMRDSSLITEMISVGKKSKNNCAIMYLKSVANPSLVAEVRRRIKAIDTDFIADIGILEQYIEDHPNNPFPTSLSTERPDRTVSAIAEGRVAIMIDGSPFSHIVPVSLFTLIHAPDDYSIKSAYGTFARLIRIIGLGITVAFPAVYLSLAMFHHEALPTDLLLAVANARSQVPFPSIVEVLILDFSFELIREGVLRSPSIIGPTIGIVGAIILGQAIIQAKIVSPIVVIIIAVTGLASYTIPEYRLSLAARIIRFAFTLMSAVMGLVGLSSGLLLLLLMFASMKSFGVPYLAPIGPKVNKGMDVFIRGAVYRQQRRPDDLNVQDRDRQPNISRKWEVSDEEGEN